VRAKQEDYRKQWKRQVDVLYGRFKDHVETLDQVKRFAKNRGYDQERVEMARRKLIGENARDGGWRAREWARFWLSQGRDSQWVVRELVALGNEESFALRLVQTLAGESEPIRQSQASIVAAAEAVRRPTRRKTSKVVAGDLPCYRTESFSGLQQALKDLLWRAAHPQQARDLVPHVSHDARTVYAALKGLAERGDLRCTTVRGTRIDRFSAIGTRRGWFSELEQRLVSERELAARGVHSRDTIKYRLGRGMPADEAASEPLQAAKSHRRKGSESATQTATQKGAWVAESGSKTTTRSSPTTDNKEIDTGRSPSATTPAPWREKGYHGSAWHEKHLKAVADRRRREALDELEERNYKGKNPQPNIVSVLGPARPDPEFLRSLGILPAGLSDTTAVHQEDRVGVVYMSALDAGEE